MTIQETIKIEPEDIKVLDDAFETGWNEALSCVNMLPSAQPEYHFDEWCTDCKEYDNERHCCPRFNQVIRTTLQEVQEAWKKGTWKREISHYDGAYHLYCSCCGECCGITIDKLNREWNFCPNCGADMRKQKLQYGDEDTSQGGLMSAT